MGLDGTISDPLSPSELDSEPRARSICRNTPPITSIRARIRAACSNAITVSSFPKQPIPLTTSPPIISMAEGMTELQKPRRVWISIYSSEGATDRLLESLHTHDREDRVKSLFSGFLQVEG